MGVTTTPAVNNVHMPYYSAILHLNYLIMVPSVESLSSLFFCFSWLWLEIAVPHSKMLSVKSCFDMLFSFFSCLLNTYSGNKKIVCFFLACQQVFYFWLCQQFNHFLS